MMMMMMMMMMITAIGIQDVPEGKVNILGGGVIVSVIVSKKL
jgi:hypothetical protein